MREDERTAAWTRGALHAGRRRWRAHASGLALLAAVAGTACGKQSPLPADDPRVATLTIVSFAYAPQNLDVPAGGAVLVLNQDQEEHTVTSASAAGTFTPGSVDGVEFDTGPFTGYQSFGIPAGSPVGTVVPYFCRIHGNAMRNEGTITVVAPVGGSSLAVPGAATAAAASRQ